LLRSIGAGDAWLETGEPRCGRSFNVAICAAKFYKKIRMRYGIQARRKVAAAA
jgi:hypothetical protein